MCVCMKDRILLIIAVMGGCPLWGYTAYWADMAVKGVELQKQKAVRSHTDYLAALQKLSEMRTNGADTMALQRQLAVAKRKKAAAHLDARLASSVEDVQETQERLQHTQQIQETLELLERSVRGLAGSKRANSSIMDRLRAADDESKDRISEIQTELSGMGGYEQDELVEPTEAGALDAELDDMLKEFKAPVGASVSVPLAIGKDPLVASNEEIDLVASLEALKVPQRVPGGVAIEVVEDEEEDDEAGSQEDGAADQLLAADPVSKRRQYAHLQ